MRYVSTRGRAADGSDAEVSGPEAVVAGLAPDGGLYVPVSMPQVDVAALGGLDYPELAAAVIGPFLPELADQLPPLLREAHAGFPAGTVPVRTTGDRAFLELFHGPTAAFKDMALQALPHLLTASRELLGIDSTALVLTATSGDTGKAALAGFTDVPGTRVLVLYPTDGVSPMQKHQMRTQPGGNVQVLGIEGNFDDAQRAVKELFGDASFVAAAQAAGCSLTSANSINLGRLLPQLAYYVHGWHQLLASGALAEGESFDVVVPTGNFGNILAASWARELGVPVENLVCASNTNRVLADFLATGVYDARRELVVTTSPSMDILVSSNLERFLHGLIPTAVGPAMSQLRSAGTFTWPGSMPGWLLGGAAGEAQVRAALRTCWEDHQVLLDPHTAVAAAVADAVWEDRAHGSRGSRVQLVAATASPYKFAPAVLAALGDEVPEDDFAAVDALAALTGVPVPESLAALRGLPVLHDEVVPVDQVPAAALASLPRTTTPSP